MVSELTEEILIPPALKSKAAAGALLNRDGDRRPGAAATKFPLNALTGHVLASPEIYCASRLHSQEEYAPCHADPAPAAGGPPSVGKLISVTGESLARSMQIRSGPLRQRKQRASIAQPTGQDEIRIRKNHVGLPLLWSSRARAASANASHKPCCLQCEVAFGLGS